MSTENKRKITIQRRQFLFGDIDSEAFDYCEKYRCKEYTLLAGKDCKVEIVDDAGKIFVLIGEIYDYRTPNETSADILKKICGQSLRMDDVFEQVEPLAGRWALFCFLNKKWYGLNDACALKQIFFTNNGKDIYSSQYELISSYLQISPSKDAKEYIELAKKESVEYCWVLNTTLYSEIERLLPNHYLDLADNKTERFWPCLCNQPIDYGAAINKASLILSNNMTALSIRHHMKLTLTVGMDTRLVYAAAKNISKDKYEVFTHINKKTGRGILDSEGAKKICKEREEKHITVECDEIDDPYYSQILEDKHQMWHLIDYKMSQLMSESDVLVKGSCAEIARNSFGLIRNKTVNPGLLCKLHALPKTNWCIERINVWLEEFRNQCESKGYEAVDMFYWEHRMGCWQAMCQNESDYYFETFTPFNCRELISVLLSIDEKKRIPNKYTAFLDIIKELDIGLLNFPINPQYKSFRFQINRFIKYRTPAIYSLILKISGG